MGPNVITSWPEKQQLIALLWVFFQCRTLCKSTCSLKIVPLIERNTYRSRLPWFRMSKYGRCRGWTRDGRIGLMVLVGVTWNITGQEFGKAWFWKVLWLGHVFFDLYPWTSRIQTGKKTWRSLLGFVQHLMRVSHHESYFLLASWVKDGGRRKSFLK